MKTTIELPDALASEARQVAAAAGTTLRSVIEEALRRELDRRRAAQAWSPSAEFAFGSGGLTPAASAMTWAEIRAQSMERAR